MRPEALEQANPWWRDQAVRPRVPRALPGGLPLAPRKSAVDVVHAAPRAGATTLLLRTVGAALDRKMDVAFVPSEASATWGTATMLDLLDSERLDLIAIDQPDGEDWPEQLKSRIDSDLSLASTWVVVATAGIDDSTRIAGRLAGRQGSGHRHLLLPRRFSDLVQEQQPKAHAAVVSSEQRADRDLVEFARALQPQRGDLREVWRSYVESGALPSAFDLGEVTNFDAQSSAARALSPGSSPTTSTAAAVLGELNKDRSMTAMDLARAAGRSDGWARALDKRAENQLVWFKVPQLGKGPGAAAKRVLVDPAYAEVVELHREFKSWEALARSLWQAGLNGDPDRVRQHPIRWLKSTSDLLVVGDYILRYEKESPSDGRTLRGLTAKSDGRTAIRVTDGLPDFRREIPVIPTWAVALAADLNLFEPGPA